MNTSTPVLSAAFLSAAILGPLPVAGQGKPPGAGANESPPNLSEPKTIFVTGGSYDGNLVQEANFLLELDPGFTNDEGLEAADAICQYHADQPEAIVPRGTYVALLSADDINASARITPTTGPIIRADGAYVAQTAADLFAVQAFDPNTGNPLYLINPIQIDEAGNDPGGLFVHTGTARSGVATDDSCDNWTTDIFSKKSTYGESGQVREWWLEQNTDNCDEPKPLYCIQQ